jgi:hypothetical protein
LIVNVGVGELVLFLRLGFRCLLLGLLLFRQRQGLRLFNRLDFDFFPVPPLLLFLQLLKLLIDFFLFSHCFFLSSSLFFF